jgi:hypothetical protein
MKGGSMRSLVLICFVIAGAAGCFSPKYGNGELRCGSGAKQCPDGYHCAVDNTCWKDGANPTPASSDDMATSEPPPDMAGATDDMTSTPPDMTVISYPPAAVWTSCGGGSSTATSGAQLNMSIGASDVSGTATGSNGATITFGFFSNDIYQ